MHDSCFSHHSVRSDAWSNITSKVITLCGELTWWIVITSVITVCAEVTDARLLHQSSLYWVKTVITIRSHGSRTITAPVITVCGLKHDYYCISHNPIWSDDWRDNSMRCHCVGSDVWRNITASAIIFCRVMSEELLLYQSSLWAEWWPVHYYCFCNHFARFDAWSTLT